MEFAQLSLKLVLVYTKTVAALEQSSINPDLLSFPMQIVNASSYPGSNYKNNVCYF